MDLPSSSEWNTWFQPLHIIKANAVVEDVILH